MVFDNTRLKKEVATQNQEINQKRRLFPEK